MSDENNEATEPKAKSKSRKILKIVLWTVGGIILVPILLIATLPLWLGTIARPSINASAPSFTQTSFNIGHLYANPYTGRIELGDFTMGNPKGYDEPTLVSISNLVFDVDMCTLDDKYVHVQDIVVDGLFVSLVKGGENNVDNIVQLQYNLAGGKEKYEANQAKAKEEQAKSEAEAKAEAEELKAKLEAMTDEEREEYYEDQAAEAAAKKKFVIDHVLLDHITVKLGFMTLPVPVKIELNDLGKESDGITMSEFFNEIWKAILKSATAIGDGAKALGGLIGDGAGAAGDALGSGAKAVGEGAGKAVDAIGDGAGKAVDTLKGLFK